MRVRLDHVTHVYAGSDETASVQVLDDVTLDIASGTFAVLILIAAIASLLWATGLLQNQWLTDAGEMIAAISGVALYVIFALGYAAIYQVKVKLGIWRTVANSTGLSNPATLETISSVGAPASAVGEGLADALNVGGF